LRKKLHLEIISRLISIAFSKYEKDEFCMESNSFMEILDDLKSMPLFASSTFLTIYLKDEIMHI
jgi:hypothetical protein